MPCYLVYSWRRVALERLVRLAQAIYVVDMAPQCRESFVPVPPCRCTYPVERMWQVYLALCPEPGLLSRLSLGQTPSLHRLRRARCPGLFVRLFRWYYGPVRLPTAVHRGCTFLLAARTLATGQGQQGDLPGSAQEVSVRAWGL